MDSTVESPVSIEKIEQHVSLLLKTSTLIGIFYVFYISLSVFVAGYYLKDAETGFIYLASVLVCLCVIFMWTVYRYMKRAYFWFMLISTWMFFSVVIFMVAGATLIVIAPFMFRSYFIAVGLLFGFGCLAMSAASSILLNSIGELHKLLILKKKELGELNSEFFIVEPF